MVPNNAFARSSCKNSSGERAGHGKAFARTIYCTRAQGRNNNNSNNSHNNVYGAVIKTKVIARVQPVHLMNVDFCSRLLKSGPAM